MPSLNNTNLRSPEKITFIAVMVVGGLGVILSIIKAWGGLGGNPASNNHFLDMIPFIFAFITLCVGGLGIIHKLPVIPKNLQPSLGWVFVSLTLLAFGFLFFNLVPSPDLASGVWGLTAAAFSMMYSVQFTLFKMDNKITDRFESLERQQAVMGRLVQIDSASVFDLEEVIIGWNPNWALELNNSQACDLSKSLTRIHQDRLTHENVKRINYVFLEGYEPHGRTDLQFGTNAFVRFLNENFSNKSNVDVSKYSIWKIEKRIWQGCTEQCDANELALFNKIRHLLDTIVISGTRYGTNCAVLFFNFPQFLNHVGHKYCLEIPRDPYSFIGWHDLYQLMTNCGIVEQKVVKNTAKTFELHNITT